MTKIIIDMDEEFTEEQEIKFKKNFGEYELVILPLKDIQLNKDILNFMYRLSLETSFIVFASECGLLMSLCSNYGINFCYSFYSEKVNEWVFI